MFTKTRNGEIGPMLIKFMKFGNIVLRDQLAENVYESWLRRELKSMTPRVFTTSVKKLSHWPKTKKNQKKEKSKFIQKKSTTMIMM